MVVGLSGGCGIMRWLCTDEHLGWTWDHQTVVYGLASWTVVGLSGGCGIMRRLCTDELLGLSWDHQMLVYGWTSWTFVVSLDGWAWIS